MTYKCLFNFVNSWGRVVWVSFFVFGWFLSAKSLNFSPTFFFRLLYKYLFYQVMFVFDFFFLNSMSHPGLVIMHFSFFTDAAYIWLLIAASAGDLTNSNTFIPSFWSLCSLGFPFSRERTPAPLLPHVISGQQLQYFSPFLCFNEVLLENSALPLLSLLSALFPVYFPLKCYSATSSLLRSCSAVVEEKTF